MLSKVIYLSKQKFDFPLLFEEHAAIKKIQSEKEKHVWAVQVLNELLRHATMYDKKSRIRTSQHQKNAMEISDGSSGEDSSDEKFEDDKSTSIKIATSGTLIKHTNVDYHIYVDVY